MMGNNNLFLIFFFIRIYVIDIITEMNWGEMTSVHSTPMV